MMLDKKNCMILNLLQENCRASLTEVSKKIGLSVDSTKKRIIKMIKEDVFFPKIQIRPRNLGFSNIVDVKIKLNNHSEKERTEFIKYLQEHKRISEIFAVSGEWDLSIVVVSQDAADLQDITSEIRSRFGRIINSWNESMTLQAYKFENYDMVRLMEGDNEYIQE